MHDYLRAVGFSNVHSRSDIEDLLKLTAEVPVSAPYIYEQGSGSVNFENCVDFSAGAGITVRGELNSEGIFTYEYYFPHYYGRCISLNDDVTAQKLSDRDEYDGIVDMPGDGVSLIFHLNRLGDYSGKDVEYIDNSDNGIPGNPDRLHEQKDRFISNASVKLSGLSISGKILIPLMRSGAGMMKKHKNGEKRMKMLEAAKNGSQEAMEKLTLERLDTYAQAVMRLEHEDVLSIVETYFMPYGIACDQYSVLGDIVDCEETRNKITGEELYRMLISSNDIMLDICINKEDLLGEPLAGRRFMGVVWLQGVLE